MANENLELRTVNTGYEELTPKQVRAIIRGISLGRKLQDLYPEIAEDYRNGMFHREIAEKYNITEQFGVSEKIARIAVRHSINGIAKIFFEIKPYSGLIQNEKELERLAQYHMVEHGKSLYEQGIGIHGMSREEKSQAGRKAAILRGHVPYTEMEKSRILELHQEIGKGVRGKNPKILQIVNQEFHEGMEVRSVKAIEAVIRKYGN